MQLQVVEATWDVLCDRRITPQEVDQYMQALVFIGISAALGSILWGQLNEAYEEATLELKET